MVWQSESSGHNILGDTISRMLQTLCFEETQAMTELVKDLPVPAIEMEMAWRIYGLGLTGTMATMVKSSCCTVPRE